MEEAKVLTNDAWLRVRAPRQFLDLADEAALEQGISLSDFTRAALVLALEMQGVHAPRIMTPRVRKARWYGRAAERVRREHAERMRLRREKRMSERVEA
jgi:hypothetical protein